MHDEAESLTAHISYFRSVDHLKVFSRPLKRAQQTAWLGMSIVYMTLYVHTNVFVEMCLETLCVCVCECLFALL